MIFEGKHRRIVIPFSWSVRNGSLREVTGGRFRITHEEEGVPPIILQKNRTVNNGCMFTTSQLGVFHAQMGSGKTIPLLKSMLTTACENDCHYCIFRRPHDQQRYSFAPEEMAGPL